MKRKKKQIDDPSLMTTEQLGEGWAQKLKCFFGFHDLVVSAHEQALLDEAMKTDWGRLVQLDTLSDGTKVVFKICRICGARR